MKETESIADVVEITVHSEWEDISAIARVAKNAIESTQVRPTFISLSDAIRRENKLLELYLVPDEGEDFNSYINRAKQMDGGIKGLARLLMRSVPARFELTKYDDSLLIVESKTGKGKYSLTITASGDYANGYNGNKGRGVLITEQIKKLLDEKGIKHNYTAFKKKV